MEPTQASTIATPATIPGVRVLFNNTQTFDLPLVSALDEVAPEFESVIDRFSTEEWIHFPNSGVAFQTSTVLAIVKINIPVSQSVAETTEPQSAEPPAETVFPVG
jgi:hypothetical protein